MKKLIFILLILFSLFTKGNASDKIPADFGMPAHPRILLTEQKEREMLAHIHSDAVWKNIHADLLEECNRIMQQPFLERKQIGMRLLAVSREALRRIFFLSYAYRTTGNNKFLERAEKEMLAVSSFSDWNPSHFLDVAEMTLGVSIGYDWLYYELSDTSRTVIANAIMEKGLKPSFEEKYNWFLQANHNWNQVCNAGMVFGAIAVYENNPDYCKTIINRSIQSVRLPMHEYSPNGAYPEGYAYWEYGTTFNVLLIDALEKIYGHDFGLTQIKGFMDTADYYEHMTAPSGKSFNYADCGEEYGLTPAMFWFAQKKNQSSLLWVEMNFLTEKYRNNYLANRVLPLALLWGAEIHTNKINPPAKTMWRGGGVTPVALMRTSWTDPKAIYVGLKGGTASSNHAHMDAGSFIMEADGVRWAMDFGSQDYESLESRKLRIWTNDQQSERWKVFRYNNYVHNTPTINGNLHNVEGKAEILSCTDKNGYMSATTDLSSVFEGDISSYERGIAIVDNSYVVVQDEITATENKEARLRWTMLTPAEVTITNENNAVLNKNGKSLCMKVVCDIPVEMKTWSTQSPNDYDALNTGTTLVGFECTVPANCKIAVEVLLLPEGATDNKKIVPLKNWK